MVFCHVLKLETRYDILKDFWFLLEDFFEDYIFCMVKYLNFHNFFF